MQRDVWEATSEQEVALRLDFQGVPTYSCLCVNSFYDSSCLCLCLWLHWPCFISDNTHHQRQQCSSVALITATWQAPTVPSIQSHTSLKPIQLACVWVFVVRVCVCAHVTTTLHHQNNERPRNMTHPTLWTLGERGRRADSQETDIKFCHRRPVQNIKDRLICWFLLFFCHFVLLFSCLNVTLSPCPRDDNFSDTLSQKADSEASSGHAGEDKCSGKDIGSPTDTRISEAFITRLVLNWLYQSETLKPLLNNF